MKNLFQIRKYGLAIALLLAVIATANAQDDLIAAKIRTYLKHEMAVSNIPAVAVAVVHQEKTILIDGYGTSTEGRQVNSNTIFPIASLSKGITAAAVMQLVDQGQIDLDAPIRRYLPHFMKGDKRAEEITVRQLLNQTSGLADTGYPEFTIDPQPQSLNQAMDKMQLGHTVSSPGTKFHYHNPNYQVLAKLVEAVSGRPFEAYVQDNIFDRLAMTSSAGFMTTDAMFGSPASPANGHIFVLGRPVATKERQWFIAGAAGISSTAADMAKWMSDQLQLKDQSKILSSRALQQMQSPPNGFTYAMGWNVDTSAHTLYHSGIFWTYSSQEMLLTDKGYGIVLLIDGGLNNTVDYFNLMQGVKAIIKGRQPEDAAFPASLYTLLIVVLIVLIITLGVRRLMRSKQWTANYISRPKWRTWTYLMLRLAPLLCLLLVPIILTALSERVLGWDRITLMFTDVVIVLGLLAALNTLIVISRVILLTKRKT